MGTGPPLSWPPRPRGPLAGCWLLLAQGTAALNLLQWNPHWECFEWNRHNCGEEFMSRLSRELVHGNIDFANIVEMSSHHRRLPPRWKALDSQCGIDRVTLIYNSDRWRVPLEPASGSKGCMVAKDRPFIVQQFTEAPAWGGSRKVVVAGAHYPHTRDRLALIRALKSVMAFSGERSVALMADTNVNSGVSSAKILAELEVPDSHLHSSDLLATCCLNSGFRPEMAYDRIITNFGSAMTSSMPLDAVPDWAQGEFHKPIKAVLVDSGTGKTSSTTTTATTATSTSTSTVPTTRTTTQTSTSTSTATSTTTTTTTTPSAVPYVFIGFASLSSFSLATFALCGIVFGRKLFGAAPRQGQQSRPLKQVPSESSEMMLADTEASYLSEEPDETSRPEKAEKALHPSPRHPVGAPARIHAYGGPPADGTARPSLAADQPARAQRSRAKPA